MERNIYYFAKYSKHHHLVLTDRVTNMPVFEVADGVSVYRVPPVRRLKIGTRARFFNILLDLAREPIKARFLGKLKFDILHLRAPYLSPDVFFVIDHYLGRTFFKKIAAWRRCKKPMIVTFHSLLSHDLLNHVPFRIPYFPQSVKERKSWIELEKLLCEKASKIICIDKYMIGVLSRFCKEEDIYYIPSGVDVKLFRPIDKREAFDLLPALMRDQLPLNKFLILYLGRLDYVKGFHLLEPLARMLPSDSKLMVAGKDPMKMNQSKGLIYLGEVSNQIAPFLINVSDVIFNPVLVKGTSRVTFEAMACGKPVIMFGDENSRYPAVHRKNAILADNLEEAAKAVLELKDSQKLYEKLSENACATANEYSVQELTKKMDRIYDETYIA